MVTLFVLMPFVALFMVINIILGCYVAIRLGYGPPNWQTALNLVVPLTTLQDCLNDGRAWLEKKTPKIDKLLTKLHVPKPIIFIDTRIIIEKEEGASEVSEEATGGEEYSEEQVGDKLDSAIERTMLSALATSVGSVT